jgi:hypothetical protein
MAPGGKTPRRVNADTREWWAIQDGQVRFSIWRTPSTRRIPEKRAARFYSFCRCERWRAAR